MDNQGRPAVKIEDARMYRGKIINAQATLEFTFGMICTVLLIWGMFRIFVWVGGDLYLRRQTHEETLLQDPGCDNSACPLKQMRPSFMETTHLQATTINSSIFGE